MSCDKNFPMSSQIFYSLTNMNNLYTTYQKRKKKKKGGGITCTQIIKVMDSQGYTSSQKYMSQADYYYYYDDQSGRIQSKSHISLCSLTSI